MFTLLVVAFVGSGRRMVRFFFIWRGTTLRNLASWYGLFVNFLEEGQTLEYESR